MVSAHEHAPRCIPLPRQIRPSAVFLVADPQLPAGMFVEPVAIVQQVTDVGRSAMWYFPAACGAALMQHFVNLAASRHVGPSRTSSSVMRADLILGVGAASGSVPRAPRRRIAVQACSNLASSCGENVIGPYHGRNPCCGWKRSHPPAGLAPFRQPASCRNSASACARGMPGGAALTT